MRPSYLTTGRVSEEEMVLWLHRKAQRKRWKKLAHRWAGIAVLLILGALVYDGVHAAIRCLF